MPIASCTHLHDGREAVGGAGCRGQQPMLAPGRRDRSLTPTTMFRALLVLDRRRDDDPLHAAVEIALQAAPASGTCRCIRARCRSRDRPRARRPACAAALKPMRRLPMTDGAVVLDAERCAPAAMDAVELEQMRGRRRAALDLVDMHDIEPVARARIVRRRDRSPPIAARSASRPMRPMPLMPTRMVSAPSRRGADCCRRSRRGAPSAPCDRARRRAGS